MTLDAHMQHPDVVAAQAAYDAYLAAHPEITHQRHLDEEGQRLHEAVVLASRRALESGS